LIGAAGAVPRCPSSGRELAEEALDLGLESACDRSKPGSSAPAHTARMCADAGTCTGATGFTTLRRAGNGSSCVSVAWRCVSVGGCHAGLAIHLRELSNGRREEKEEGDVEEEEDEGNAEEDEEEEDAVGEGREELR
jgi:hypothetical protein